MKFSLKNVLHIDICEPERRTMTQVYVNTKGGLGNPHAVQLDWFLHWEN